MVPLSLLLLAASAAAVGPKPLPPPAAEIPAGRVLVEIAEQGVPPTDAWHGEYPVVSERYFIDALALSRVPHKYIDTGVIADRSNPYLLRASADVELPKGTHRILLRGHGATRLWIDGRLVLTLPFPPPPVDGHNPIRTDYLDLGPDFRFAPPGNREKWTPFRSEGRKHRVVVESIVGGKKKTGELRPEIGETVVAVSPEGETSFRLMSPKQTIAYTDEGWASYAAAESVMVDRIEADRRAEARRGSEPYWKKRRDAAARWLAETPDEKVPALPNGFPANNAIDHFLAVKIAEARKRSTNTGGTVDFPRDVRPLLEAKCFNCHQGQKVRGGLQLDLRELAIAGGDTGEPAITPGEPEQSSLLKRVTTAEAEEVMPPRGERLTKQQINILQRWIQEGARWESSGPGRITQLTDDLTFLRRVTLDTVGVVPTEQEISDFLADARPDKRERVIDRLLADPRWADHWVGYWQDVLAENPNILNPTLNNTGPFRWWLHESLLDGKPIDLFVTELVRMNGSHYLGGPAGFAAASENDVPAAEKGAIVSAAFLGVQMKCARCHDSPGHRSTQKELFQLAALLHTKPIKVPKTSSVPQDKLHAGGRQPLIKVTLKPGVEVKPDWPFRDLLADHVADLLPENATTRDRLAALLTSPRNERFAQVIANRVWARLMGRGIVEPVDDWEKGTPTHPELLRFLGRELVRGGYDVKHVQRLILGSHAYQRAADPGLKDADPLHTAPARRRLGAEQVVDSLFHAAGKRLDTEEVNLDVDSGRDRKNSISLGKPRRAWQFASTSNERDRPSLALPRVQAVVDVLEAFGWRSTRQDPTSVRESAPNVLQPAILSNGTVAVWLTRLSEDHDVTRLALEEQSVEQLVDRLYLRVLTRRPRPDERAVMVEYLRTGYDQRKVEPPVQAEPARRQPPRYVSWSNHLQPESSRIKIELQAAARRGDPPTERLDPDFRRRLEDVLWALLNAPEFVFTP